MTNEEAKVFLDNLKICINEHPIVADWLVEIADRKTENSSEFPNNCEPKICDTCRYYNSYMPCGSTPDACKKADKFAEEFVDGLKKLKTKTEPQIEPNLILPERMERGEMYEVGDSIVVMNSEDYYDLLCKSWEKDEPQTDYDDYERAVEQMQHDTLYEPTYNAEDGSM